MASSRWQLSDERLRELARCCQTESVPRNSDPFRLRGLEGQVVYLVSGELKLSHGDGMVEVVVGGCDSALRPLPSDLAERASEGDYRCRAGSHR